MVQYKLYYFNGRGRAEVIRLIFVTAGVEYEDVRISREEWPSVKPSKLMSRSFYDLILKSPSEHRTDMPLGQMPVLEVDGAMLCQSGAITRYLANQYGMAGKSDMEKYWVDAFKEAMEDIALKYPFYEKDEEKQAELAEQFFDETGPDGLKQLEKLYCEYNDGTHRYFVGELTVADLTLISFVDFLKALKEDIFDCVPDLVSLDKRLRKIPTIKAWIERRPQSEF